MKQFLYSLTSLLFISTSVQAQVISPVVTNNYSDAVIRKVYDLTTQMDLNYEKQQILAKHYKKEDSAIAAAIRTGIAPKEVAGMALQFKDEFLQLLSKQEYEAYYLGPEMVFLDSLFKQLNALRPIPDTDKQRITEKFLQRRKISSAENRATAFMESIPGMLKDTVYYAHLFQKEIEYTAEKYVNSYPKRRGYPADKADAIMKDIRVAVKARKKNLRAVDYMLPNSSQEKDRVVSAVLAKHEYIIRKAEIANGIQPPKTLFATALYEKKLNLTKRQTDSLLEYAVKTELDSLIAKKNADPSAGDFKTFERQTITRLIGIEKYANVLAGANIEKAKLWAVTQWKDLDEMELSTGKDSTRTINEMTSFQLRKLVAKEMFAADPDKLEAELRSINKAKPAAIRALELAKKYPDKKEALRNNYSW